MRVSRFRVRGKEKSRSGRNIRRERKVPLTSVMEVKSSISNPTERTTELEVPVTFVIRGGASSPTSLSYKGRVSMGLALRLFFREVRRLTTTTATIKPIIIKSLDGFNSVQDSHMSAKKSIPEWNDNAKNDLELFVRERRWCL